MMWLWEELWKTKIIKWQQIEWMKMSVQKALHHGHVVDDLLGWIQTNYAVIQKRNIAH